MGGLIQGVGVVGIGAGVGGLSMISVCLSVDSVDKDVDGMGSFCGVCKNIVVWVAGVRGLVEGGVGMAGIGVGWWYECGGSWGPVQRGRGRG